MQYNGLKFSFSLLAQQHGNPTATPKFTSIDIKQDISSRQVIEVQGINMFGSPHRSIDRLRNKKDSKSSRILEKYSHLTLANAAEKDNRSVKSVQSSKPRTYYRSKTEATSLKAKSNKNRHSSVSTTNLYIDNSPRQPSRQHHSLKKNNSKDEQDQTSFHLYKPKGTRISNSPIQSPSKTTAKLRLTDKICSLRQSQRKLKQIPDKGKSFKSILHKVRPVLRINGRALNNNKLQQMSKSQQIEEELTFL